MKMSFGATPLVAYATMRASGFAPRRSAARIGADDHGGAAVAERRGVAGRHGAALAERRLQLRQRFQPSFPAACPRRG